VVGAILGYPALGSIAPLCAYPVEWGPILLALRIRSKLLLPLGVLHKVLGRYLGLAVSVLLQERIEVVLVLLGGRGQMRAGPLLLPLLRGWDAVGVLQLLLLLLLLLGEPRITLSDRLAAPYVVLGCLLCGLVFLAVPREAGGKAAAERLLGLVEVGWRRLRLVGVGTALVSCRRQLGRTELLLLLLRVALGGLVEMRAQAVGARRARRVRLLLVRA
jgi:hypothetical protein